MLRFFLFYCSDRSSQMFLLFVHCSRVQTLGLRRYRGKIYFSDSTFLSMWAVSSFVWISLVLMLPEILLVISPSSFFISPRAPRTTGIVNFLLLNLNLNLPNPIDFIFQICFLGELPSGFCRDISFRWNYCVNQHASSFFLALDDKVRSVCLYIPDGVNRYIPYNCDYFSIVSIL